MNWWYISNSGDLTNMNKKLKTLGLIMLALGALFFYASGNVRAQSDAELGIPTGIQVSPSRFDWDVEDGQEKTGVINLKNFSDSFYKVKIEIEDFYVSDDSTEARFFVPDENHPLYAYDVINWIEADNQEIDLGPKEGKDIVFKVRVPEGTPTGGYYGVVFFNSKVQDVEVKNEEGTASAQIGINQRVGTLLVMAVKGDQPIKRSGEIIEFTPEKKIFWQKPAQFKAVVKNSGNLHFKALGSFEIDKFGKRLVGEEIPGRILYPDRTREYQQKWDFSSWSYGYYKAKISLVSEDGEIRMDGETSFWVIPWKTTVSIIILLVIVYLILKIFSTKFEIRKKSVESEGQIKEEKKNEEGNVVENAKNDEKNESINRDS